MSPHLGQSAIHHPPDPPKRMIAGNSVFQWDVAKYFALLFVGSAHVVLDVQPSLQLPNRRFFPQPVKTRATATRLFQRKCCPRYAPSAITRFFFIQGIIERNSAPTFSIGCFCPASRSCLKFLSPVAASFIHSLANLPD